MCLFVQLNRQKREQNHYPDQFHEMPIRTDKVSNIVEGHANVTFENEDSCEQNQAQNQMREMRCQTSQDKRYFLGSEQRQEGI